MSSRLPNQDPKDPHEYVLLTTLPRSIYFGEYTGSVPEGLVVHGTMVYKRVRVPCRYCWRYDSTIEYVEQGDLKGVYHTHCLGRIIMEAQKELANRMK